MGGLRDALRNKPANETVTSDEWLALVQDASLPIVQPWEKCVGSLPHLRGYPCSVWTAFHVLSVKAAKMYEIHQPDEIPNGRIVLDIMQSFVEHFFTCRDCAQHFLSMALTSTSNVSSADDVVLWLWNAHNEVNGRTKGSASEDPTSPKVQWPNSWTCPSCRDQDGSWDRDNVLAFLKRFYSFSQPKVAGKGTKEHLIDPSN